MTSRISQQATALALAAVVSFGLLAGVNGLAASEAAAVHAQIAQTVVAQPA